VAFILTDNDYWKDIVVWVCCWFPAGVWVWQNEWWWSQKCIITARLAAAWRYL